jgi:ribosomal protein S18 acetylase RimI-like enzyme
MDEPRLVPASAVSLEQLTTAFNRAFEGYLVPLSQTPESLASMMRTNDVDLEESLVALGPDGAPIGIGLLARRDERAWIGGMGLAPEWRGRGHGTTVMAALIQRAQAMGLRQVQLEVLEENLPARRLYVRLGFADVRRLHIYTGRPTPPRALVTLSAEEDVRALPSAQALGSFEEMHAAVAPCWQRELASLRHMASGLRARGLFGPDGVRAYVLFSHMAGSVALLDAGSRAPTAEERARHIRALVRALIENTPRASLRAINVPPGDPLGDALNALGCPVVSRQREMTLPLSS